MTGFQTCALPISKVRDHGAADKTAGAGDEDQIVLHKRTMVTASRRWLRDSRRRGAEFPICNSGNKWRNSGDDSIGPRTVAAGQKMGRDDLCPCGSGKEYKELPRAG